MSKNNSKAVAPAAPVAKEEKKAVKTRVADYIFKAGKVEVGVRLSRIDKANVPQGAVDFLKEILEAAKRVLKADLYISPGRLSLYLPTVKGKQFTLDTFGRCIHVGENMRIKGSLDHQTPKRQLQIFYTDAAELAMFNLNRNPYKGSCLTLKGKTVINKDKRYESISLKDFAAILDRQIQG